MTAKKISVPNFRIRNADFIFCNEVRVYIIIPAIFHSPSSFIMEMVYSTS